jgi:hypothetical protein
MRVHSFQHSVNSVLGVVTRAPRAVRFVPGVLAGGLVLLGCNDGKDPSIAARQGPIVVATEASHVPGEGSASAQVGGVLRFEAGCAQFELEGYRYTPVWPIGTEWLESAQMIRTADGRTFAVGDEIVGSGRYSSTDDLRARADLLLADCGGATQEVAILQELAENS